MNLTIHCNRYRRRLLSILLVIGLTAGLGCSGYDPCTKVQKGQECSGNAECNGGESCWCGWCVLEECTGVLEFADYSLESSVRNEIDKPSDDIRYEDVMGLKVLHGGCVEDGICIGSLDGIQCLTSLQELYLSHQSISELSDISNLTKLTILDIADNIGLSDITPLLKLTSITDLDISENEISSIASLSGMTVLKKLNISYNQISDISSLDGMTALEILDLSANEIGSYSPLSGLDSVVELYANGASNSNGDISSLSNLTTLEILELRWNNVTSLMPLTNLVLLNHIDLSRNDINDVSPLVDNQGISEGDWVDIYNNPIDCFEQSTNIQALRDRGVLLDTSCP